MKSIFISRSLKAALLIICLLAVSDISYGGNIIVRPGRFDHFTVQVPDRIRAGEGFAIRLQAYDAHDNLITDFGEAGKDFRVSVSGSAQVQPSILKAASFMGGSAVVSIMDKKTETITLSIYEVNGTVPVLTRDITIYPNKIDHFLVQAPQSVTAGNNFEVKIIAKDAFDNTVTDANIDSRNIRISSSGTIGFKVVGAAPAFKDGVGVAVILAEKTGEAAVEVQETATGNKGRSPSIKVMPAGLSYFKVNAPKEAVAGEPFEITIGAFDAFDNKIENYSSYGGGVNITSTGQAKPSPSFIGQSEFIHGQAVVKLRYDRAEEISIVATESNKTQQGKSTVIKVNPSAPENLVVITPDSAVAGQKFRIKIEAYDRFNNIVRDYNLIGSDVYLNATGGTGVLTPRIISASEFIDGIASVDVMYDKAESFTIFASMAAKREEKKVLLKEQKKEVMPAEVAKVIEIPVQVAPAVEKAEKLPAATVKEKEAKKKESVATRDKKQQEKFFEVKKLSLIEAKNKAMLVINLKAINGNIEYKDRMESLQGRDWIILNLKPVVNKAKKSWKFESAFIREVILEEDRAEKGALNVRIGLMSKQVKFEVNRVKNSVVVSIVNP